MRPFEAWTVETGKGKAAERSKGKRGTFDRPGAGKGLLCKEAWVRGFSNERLSWVGDLDSDLLDQEGLGRGLFGGRISLRKGLGHGPFEPGRLALEVFLDRDF